MCLPRAVLMQIRYDPKVFNEKLFCKMIAFHLLRYPEIFYPYIKEDLGDQSYVSYCRNIYEGNVWGDDIMLAAIAHMWNLSISVIVPNMEILHIFHDQYEEPDIVIVSNGGPPESLCPATHFSATRSRLINPKVIGRKQLNRTPKVYESYEEGAKVCQQRKEERLKRTVFTRLRDINFRIDTLEEDMSVLGQKLKDAKKTRNAMEQDLSELGFNIQTLRAVRKDPYVQPFAPEVVEEGGPIPEYVPRVAEGENETATVSQKDSAVASVPDIVPKKVEGYVTFLKKSQCLKINIRYIFKKVKM